jgi:hypothetical protein
MCSHLGQTPQATLIGIHFNHQLDWVFLKKKVGTTLRYQQPKTNQFLDPTCRLVWLSIKFSLKNPILDPKK